MRGCLLIGVGLTAALLSSSGLAQQQLVVDGHAVAGLSTDLVPGTAYAPAQGYAQALGATYRSMPQGGVLLEYGGRYLSLEGFNEPARAGSAEAALTLDGEALPGPGAVIRGGVPYLPVKRVTEALGGMTAYLEAQQTVAVVFPRPRLQSVTPPNIWGSSERFVLLFSAPVDLEPFYEASLRVVRLRFPRAELTPVPLVSERLSGSRYSDAVFIPEADYLDFNLTLREGNTYSVFSEPVGEGVRVVIDIFRDDGAVGDPRPVLLLRAEAGTENLARRLQAALSERQLEVVLSQETGAGADMRSGAAATLLIVLKRGPLEGDRFNLYALSESSAVPLLHAPLRRANVQETLSGAERGRVANLQPDLAWGERAAAQLAEDLETNTLLRRGQVLAAPLLALSGAAGRGLLLELGPASLTDAALAPALATSLATLAGSP